MILFATFAFSVVGTIEARDEAIALVGRTTHLQTDLQTNISSRIDVLNERIEELNSQIKQLEGVNKELREEVQGLQEQVRSLGGQLQGGSR